MYFLEFYISTILELLNRHLHYLNVLSILFLLTSSNWFAKYNFLLTLKSLLTASRKLFLNIPFRVSNKFPVKAFLLAVY